MSLSAFEAIALHRAKKAIEAADALVNTLGFGSQTILGRVYDTKHKEWRHPHWTDVSGETMSLQQAKRDFAILTFKKCTGVKPSVRQLH